MVILIQFAIAAFFYLFSVISIFKEPLVDNFGSIQWDAASVHFFNLFFSSETWHSGIFPLWSPYIFAGFPQIADLQVAFFYPINLFISSFAVFTPEIVMYQIIFHYFLACFFAFLFARYLSNNFFFSLAAGLVYAFGGFMVGHASHVGMQNTATWLPLIFLFLMLAFERSKIVYTALCGLFLGIAILAGHFQISLYIAYAIAFYFIFDAMWTIACSSDRNLLSLIIQKIRLTSIVYIIAFLVSSIQLLPTYELTQLSNRSKITLEMSQTESLNPLILKSLIKPNYNNVSFGTPYLGPWDRTQNYLYLGKAVIILAILGLFLGIYCRNTRKITLFWFLLLIISLLYSFGDFWFLQKYFYRFVPFFDKIRAPSNMMLLFNFSTIGLASSFFSAVNELFKKYTERLAKAETQLKNINSVKFPAKHISSSLGIIVLFIISMEIFSAVLPNTLLYSRQKTGEIIAAAPIASRIVQEYSSLEENGKFRIFKVPNLNYNLSQLLHFFAFDGYNPLSLKRHANYADAMVKNPSLINLAGIKYLPCEFISSRANDLEKIGALCVNKDYSNFAFFVDNFIKVTSESEALQKIQEVDLKKFAVLEEYPPRSVAENFNESNYNGAKTSDKISIYEFKPGSLKIDLTAEKNSFLLLGQTYYPGWSAKIDGTNSKIYQADYLFQAVYVPNGKHTILMEYKSRPLIIGAILTIIGLSCVLVISLSELYQRRKIPNKSNIQ